MIRRSELYRASLPEMVADRRRAAKRAVVLSPEPMDPRTLLSLITPRTTHGTEAESELKCADFGEVYSPGSDPGCDAPAVYDCGYIVRAARRYDFVLSTANRLIGGRLGIVPSGRMAQIETALRRVLQASERPRSVGGPTQITRGSVAFWTDSDGDQGEAVVVSNDALHHRIRSVAIVILLCRIPEFAAKVQLNNIVTIPVEGDARVIRYRFAPETIRSWDLRRVRLRPVRDQFGERVEFTPAQVDGLVHLVLPLLGLTT